MGTSGCYSQSLKSPYIPPDVWCRNVNVNEPYCYGDSCVECIDRGCPIERPFCVNFKCVECEESGNCGKGKICSPEGKCVEPILTCAQADDPDSWCEEHEGLGRCDPARSKCVECIEDLDCRDSSKPHCHGDECVECGENAHCGLGYICDNSNECIEGCSDNLDCPADNSHCSQKTGKCEECWSSEHCSDGFICTNYVCVWDGCNKDDSLCPPGYYCPNNDCIEGCQNPGNCPVGKPYCSAETGSCEECLVDSHCPGDDYLCPDFSCIHKDNLPEEHPSECEYSGDCGGNWICIYGQCYEGCIGSAFCGAETPICSWESTQTVWREGGWGTTYGECAECTGPEHCAEGYICHNGTCQPDIPEAEWECEEDIECDMGVCEKFRCVECRGPENCSDGWTCDSNVCVKGCKGPEECPADRPFCSGALGYCVECTGKPHCPEGYDCDNYHCVWTGCEGNDSLCPLGYYCDISECVVGCRDKGNCPDGRPHCSGDGKCEECTGTPHCPDGYECRDYLCIWVGISCFGDDSKCPKGEWCPSIKCVEGCQNNANCPDGTPYCSIAAGGCVECWSPNHCAKGQHCVDHHCVERVAVCTDKYDCGFGERCKHGTCIKIECHDKINCDAGEWCDDGVCKSYTEECGSGCADGYFCNEENGRCERIECKTYKDCGLDECCETIGSVNKCVTCTAAKCDALHRCRSGWTCDLSTNLCVQKECASPAGCPDFYDCIYGICTPQNCAGSSAPDEFCRNKMGSDWVCDMASGGCVQLTCDSLANPDEFCQGKFGPTYICKAGACVEIGFYEFASPDAYCQAYKGEYWRWNFVTETCEKIPCNLYDNPDAMCESAYGELYKCIDGTCSKLPGGAPCHDNQECTSGLRCIDGRCLPIECRQSWDCSANESCVNGVCIALGRECVVPEDCNPGYFCNPNLKCQMRACEDNADCPIDYCCIYPPGGGVNAETKCAPCETGYCDGPGDCPLGWECNLDTGKCERKLCDYPEECGPGYTCVHGYCVAFTCATAEDPAAFCQQWWGENTYCNMNSGTCEDRKCNSYHYPYDSCEEQLGGKYKCDWSTGECRYKTIDDYPSPDLWCQEMNGNDWWFWDETRGKCYLPACNSVHNPDAFCEDSQGEGYRCIGGRCVRGKEGDKCDIPEDCARGFRCKDGFCSPTECYTLYQCGTGRWCDDGICRDNDNSCKDNSYCRPDYYCHPDTKQCAQRTCIDHSECGDGTCCFDGWCIPCEAFPCEPGSCPPGWDCIQGYCSQQGCVYDHDCPRGFYCDPSTKQCVVSFQEELSRKCRNNSDCGAGEICVGASFGLGIPDPWYGAPFVQTWGVCIRKERKNEVIKIEGVVDDRTCDYCLGQIGNYYLIGTATLPPYHKHCRCWAEEQK